MEILFVSLFVFVDVVVSFTLFLFVFFDASMKIPPRQFHLGKSDHTQFFCFPVGNSRSMPIGKKDSITTPILHLSR